MIRPIAIGRRGIRPDPGERGAQAHAALVLVKARVNRTCTATRPARVAHNNVPQVRQTGLAGTSLVNGGTIFSANHPPCGCGFLPNAPDKAARLRYLAPTCNRSRQPRISLASAVALRNIRS